MGQVSVTVAGRVYRMACGDGEEKRIEALAQSFDGKINEFKAQIGDIGEMRLHVMAGLFFADEVDDLSRRLASAERRLADLEMSLKENGKAGHERRLATIAAVEAITRRIEGLAALPAPGRDP